MVSLTDSPTLALSFLFQRLKWPVPMARWRTAKEIRNLLNDPDTRSSTTGALLDYLEQCRTESEVCEILTIVFLTCPDARPTHAALASRIHYPSVLGDMVLERIYGPGCGIGGWHQTHSGRAPVGFKAGDYFEQYKTAHVPPILVSNLRELERASGYPFLQHWAYEWKILRDQLDTRYTRYPHYFDDVLEARSGVTGQYWQRMREVYLSAYLRTLAYAVGEWHMPPRIAEDSCLEIVHGIAGLFDVEPGARPAWLSDLPERLCAPDADFAPLVRELVQAAHAEGLRPVSLNTPVASSVRKHARLTVTAHLVTPDYELTEDGSLDEKMLVMPVADTFELKGSVPDIMLQDAKAGGRRGDGVAVCASLFPIPFGTWQSDYLSMGLRIPAPYIVPSAEIRCTQESIDCIAHGGTVASRTEIWNDGWVPPHPSGGTTRCGTVTMLREELLAQALERLGRKLAFFVRLRVWDREGEYGEYSESERTFLLRDQDG